MFPAALTSRCSAKPQEQTCWRCREHFSAIWPQLLHRWMVPRAFRHELIYEEGTDPGCKKPLKD
jgi:hypothetical protein